MSRMRFLVLVALSIAAAGVAFVTHLTLRFQNVAIGYEVQSRRDDAVRLRERKNQLMIVRARQRAPDALEEIGRSLGMVDADRVTTLVAGGGTRPARLSGRPR